MVTTSTTYNLRGRVGMLAVFLMQHAPTAEPRIDFHVVEDGPGGQMLVLWDEVKLGPVPTQANIDAAITAYEPAAAAAASSRQQAIAACKAYDRTTATAAEVRNTLGAALYLLREVIREVKP
jgi:hypothetical protein